MIRPSEWTIYRTESSVRFVRRHNLKRHDMAEAHEIAAALYAHPCGPEVVFVETPLPVVVIPTTILDQDDIVRLLQELS